MARPRKERELPRVQRIELSEKNTRLRWILAGVLLVIGLVAIAIGVNSCVKIESGWQEVQIAADKTNCSGDFVLNYCYGQSDLEPTLERRQVVACYSSAVVEAYELFNIYVEDSNLGNLTQLNALVNTPVAVEPELYNALQIIAEAEDRHVFLAAVNEEYRRIFRADSQVQAAEFDPSRNEALLPYIQQAAAFASDPTHISLELLADGRAQLTVSQEYLAFAQENGIENFLDFGWMKNAFIADYLANAMIEAGHTNGYLASFDGFTRNLDAQGNAYSQNLFDRQGNEIFLPAVLQYDSPMSIVFLRNFPMTSRDYENYYQFSDGRIATALLDPADGMSKSATDNLVSYSKNAGCAEITLALAPVFIADQLDTETLDSLTERQIYSIWFDGDSLVYNDADAIITVNSPEGVSYRKQLSQTK